MPTAMASRHTNTFANIFGDCHPALVRPAGLSSGGIQRAADRGSAVNDVRTYRADCSPVWQVPLPITKDVPSSLSVEGIERARPSSRPFLASSQTPNLFHTNRHTSPLVPSYRLASSPQAATSTHDRLFGSTQPAGNRPGSRSLDISDIDGARRRPASVPRKPDLQLQIGDIVPPRQRWPTRTPSTLSTQGIEGASCSPKVSRGPIDSPGRGTLCCADIQGSTPGNARTTWALGRWPQPQNPKWQFSIQPRKTVMQKSLTSAD